jgi:hypothetical protein
MNEFFYTHSKLLIIKVLSSERYEKTFVLWSQENVVYHEQLLLKNFLPEWLVSRPNHAITPFSVIQGIVGGVVFRDILLNLKHL